MFRTTRPPLRLRPLANFRDLGGIPVSDGLVTPGLLGRGDDLSFIDENGARALSEAGTSLIVDLRSLPETAYTGRGPLGDMDITYLHQPLTDDTSMPGATALAEIAHQLPGDPRAAELMGHWYVSLVEGYGAGIRGGLESIADAPGPAVFHCVAGKDRTGVFAACLLSLLGADDEAIIADYVRTNAAMPQVLDRISQLAEIAVGGHAAALPLDSVLLSAPETAMRTMLQVLHERYGGLNSQLREAGVDGELVSALRERLITR
ncbi:tyrosine-protein phosphatase [Corynebacterium hylobatis]|uniref:Tyrosine-protein phosphatase n=1 Tax=Corynebacterium hylobatis TaxID=1859290 RepID=A0A3S0HHJ4_9CORY|nr:tyrosine-protein phosphatase [Corynebacterium hylobatis]RSZ63812.1 tyrosine-protein phosphatase [Corynebacterium hylobatis]